MAPQRITQLPRRLAELTGQPGPSGRKVYQLAVDARFPAVQINGRWYFDEADLAEIAAAFGMSLPDDRLPKHTSPSGAAPHAYAA